MASIDFAAVALPLSEADPCGPDLDMEGDPAFMNFLAKAEGLLPASYFSFERSSIDFDGELRAAGSSSTTPGTCGSSSWSPS
jgi:type VI secretion system protein ImpA